MEIFFDNYVLAFMGFYIIKLLWLRLWGYFKTEDRAIS